jgi:hypothetical protein
MTTQLRKPFQESRFYMLIGGVLSLLLLVVASLSLYSIITGRPLLSGLSAGTSQSFSLAGKGAWSADSIAYLMVAALFLALSVIIFGAVVLKRNMKPALTFGTALTVSALVTVVVYGVEAWSKVPFNNYVVNINSSSLYGVSLLVPLFVLAIGISSLVSFWKGRKLHAA